MTPLVLGLVLVSACAHATWNLLLKRSGNPLIYTWNLNIVGAVVALPLALANLHAVTLTPTGWSFMLGTAVLHSFYFTLLALAYRRGDLSLAYPLARGTGVALVPVGATLFLGEHLSFLQGVAIGCIVLGLGALQFSGAFLAGLKVLRPSLGPGAGFALLTGITIAGYHLWDKVGVQHVPPSVYVPGLFLGPAVVLSLILARQAPQLREAWRLHPLSMLAGGVLSVLAYWLILIALQAAQVSYVAPLRELGVVIGTLMGMTLLGEPAAAQRLAGAGLVTAGAITLGLASAR
jgi:drug/metabolite transporter (DMT)-like permease